MNQAAEKTQEQINISFGEKVESNKLVNTKPLSVSKFYQIIRAHEEGGKFGPYFIRGLCKGKRRDENMQDEDVQLVIIDGDKGLDRNGNIIEDIAPDPNAVHEGLKALNLHHVLYTSHSHAGLIDGTDQYKVKWRAVIWFKGNDWRTATRWIVDELNEMGLGVVCVPEMLKLSIPWFTARVDPDRVGTERSWIHYGELLTDIHADVMRHPAAFQLVRKDKGGTRPDIEPVPGIGRRLSQEEFLGKFEAVAERPGNPGQYMARCPAHIDNNPSLHVTFDARTGKTAVHCYGDCETVAVLNEVGLNFVDLPERDPRTGNKTLDAMGSGFAGISRAAISSQALPEATQDIAVAHVNADPVPEDLPEGPEYVEYPVPDEIMNPPGLMGRMTRNIMECGIKDNPVIAYSTMLAGLSFFSVNAYRYAPMKTPLALYIIQMADTGDGKEDGRKWLANVATRIGISNHLYEDISSGAALVRSMARYPLMLYMVDEYGRKLKQAKEQSNGGNIRELITEEMKFFGKGCGSHHGRRYAEEKKNIDTIAHPYLVKYATTTGSSLADGLTSDDATSGHLNRNLLFKGLDECPPPKREVGELDQSIVECLGTLAQGGFTGGGTLLAMARLEELVSNQPKSRIGSEHDARGEFAGGMGQANQWTDIIPTVKAYDALFQYNVDVNNKPKEVRDIWSRAHMQVIIVASLYCLAEWAEAWVTGNDIIRAKRPDPILELKHVEYAKAVVNWSTENWVELMKGEVSDTDFEHLTNRIMLLMRKARSYKQKKYQNHLKRGIVPKGFIADRIRVDPFLLDRALTMLVTAENITREDQTMTNGNTLTFYRLAPE